MRKSYNKYHKEASSDTNEHYRFLFWEITLLSIAFLLYHELFDQIQNIVKHTYFIKDSSGSSDRKSISIFCGGFFQTLVNYRDPDGKRHYSYAGEILKTREYQVFFELNDMVQSDNVIFTLCMINKNWWTPRMHIFMGGKLDVWVKLVSQEYFEKIKVMFGVENIVKFKELLKNTNFYQTPISPWHDIQTIESSVNIDDIGTFN